MLRGRLARLAYAKALGLRVIACAGLTLFFPIVVQALAWHVLDCGHVGGACGTLGVIVFFYGKPIIYVAFVLSLAGPVVRRVRDLGLPGGGGLLLLALLVCNWRFGVLLGNIWTPAFGLGFAHGSRAMTAALLVAAAGLLALCFVPSAAARQAEDDGRVPIAAGPQAAH